MSPLTGIGQYTFHLVHQLQQLHLAPWLFYGIGWQQEIRAAAVPNIGTAKKLFKRVVPQPYAAMRFMLQRRFASGVRRHQLRIYHEPNFMAYRFDGPTVVTVHDLSWVRYPETHPRERVRQMDRWMPETVERAAQILVDSEFVRREVISHYGVEPERVTTALLGVTSDFKFRSAQECEPALRSYGLRYGQYMLAVGTLEPRKNLSTVLSAFAQLPHALRRRFPLVIAGMTGWGNAPQSAMLRKMTACGEAHLVGYVPQADLPMLYAGARLFVYPSLYEGFGLPPLEAMACGVPVIASSRASLAEVVGDSGILVEEPLDDAGLAQHMRRVIEDEQLHASLAQAGQDRARLFTWRNCALKTVEAYRKALVAG
jgi:alpha-1,3-rhamnosyl/mannosyltransferase